MSVTAHALLVTYVIVARLVELAVARRNTRRLLARGGVEAGRAHYPAIVVLHAGWLAVVAFLIPTHAPPAPVPLILFLIVQGLRYWVIVSLGERWTTRIIVVPGAPLVTKGPYRWLRHPNYVVVAAEIALLPLVFGAWEIALVFSLLNGVVLWRRIRTEERALGLRPTEG
ncbi:MAG: hypothetical protein IPM60_12785 [Rhodospirillales bacterium]|nr:hypothetical protein [Rhodospirillales bacterium]